MTAPLLSPKDWAEQETPVNLTSGASTGYGLGVGIAVARRSVEGQEDGRADHGHARVAQDGLAPTEGANEDAAEGRADDGRE